jgi:LmbE family N-acetylglucosaminyl deacetylase
MWSVGRVTVAALAAITVACAHSRRTIPELDTPITSATRLLVFAPHPDDETLGAAGLIERVRSAGGAVRVVLMTSGDAFAESRQASQVDASDYRRNGIIREHESVAAMERLGLDRSDVLPLGFPDMGLCFLASTYLTTAAAYESPYTDRERPPPAKQVIRGVEYRGIDVRLELERIITAFKPSLVVMPHSRDDHPDHCATEIFVQRALDLVRRQQNVKPQVLHYVIHYFDWPLSRDAGSGTDLYPPANFPAAEGQWRSLRLHDQETDLKRQAIASYATQERTMGAFLEAFVRHNELFVDGTQKPAEPECWCDDNTVATTLPAGSYRHRPKPRS